MERVHRSSRMPSSKIAGWRGPRPASIFHLGRWRKSEVREYIEAILMAVAVAFALRAFVIEAFKIPSGSMIPTLMVGDHIFVNKFSYGPAILYTHSRVRTNMPPKRGDVDGLPVPRAPRPGLHQARHRHRGRQARGARGAPGHQWLGGLELSQVARGRGKSTTSPITRSTRATSTSSTSECESYFDVFTTARRGSSPSTRGPTSRRAARSG